MADAFRADALRVCLILEGSYPYVTGGVSAWVQELINALPAVNFVLFTISPKAGQTARYALPPNVVEHRDLVINEKQAITARPTGVGPLVEDIISLHAAFASKGASDLGSIIARMPVGYHLYADSVLDPAAWQMVVDGSQSNNPVYPFSDYFWSWKGSHDLAFTILGAECPAADVYHAVSTGYAGLAGVVAKIRTGKPFLLTEHGLYHKEREMEIKRAAYVKGYQRDMWVGMYNTMSRMAYRSADLVISLFEYNRRRQIELGVDPDAAIVIPNGVDIPRFSSIPRKRREGFSVGLVGRVVPIKDIKTFIMTARIAADALPDARFFCIGPLDEDPAYYEDCRALVESFHLADRFEFTGKQDVRGCYAFLDVVLLTSVREAQPLVILEAYAAGLPVVSTKVGNVPELLDYDERFLAAPKDAEKLAHAVRYIHDHPREIGELVQKNMQKVARFHDKVEVYKRYGRIYRQLARKAEEWPESVSS
jgi:glycosyltransferase involved in cell wall biosynthesis